MTGDTLTIARVCFFFFFNDTATTEIYTLSLHDALPIYGFVIHLEGSRHPVVERMMPREAFIPNDVLLDEAARIIVLDRKSTRLNSSHSQISYAVFCLKKKKNTDERDTATVPSA